MRPDVETALDQCLAWMRGGLDLESCLARYPEYAVELRPLLETVARMGRVLTPPAADEARQAGRARMLAAAARKQEQQARMGNVARLMRRLAQALTPGWQARSVPVWRPAAALLSLALVLAIGWAAVAAPSSLPGDLLYPLKQARWELHLGLTRDPSARQALEGQFEAAKRRDVGAALQAGQQAGVQFSGQVEAMEAGLWTVSGLPVEVGPETVVQGQPKVGTQVQVQGELPGDGSLQATWIEAQADDTDVPTATPTPTPTATATATATVSPSPTHTRAPDTPQPSETPEPIPSDTPEPTATNTPTPTNTPEPSDTPAPTATGTPTPEDTPEPGGSPEPTGWPTGITPPTYTPEPRDPVTTPEATDTPEPEETDEPEETPEPTETPKVEETHQAPSVTPKPTDDDDD